jgi:phytoene dehydrogenase-like protein
VIDISTPLTIEDYLNTPRGGAVGLDVTPKRFVDAELRDLLDPVSSPVKGLYMTGQDTMLGGVTLCQVNYFTTSPSYTV